MHYFKYDIDDLNQLFIPWKVPELAEYLTKQEIRQTRLKHAETFYKHAWVDFWNGVETDSLGMDDYIGGENEELPKEILVDYNGFQKEIGIKAFREDLENYVNRLRENFHVHLESKLEKAKTDIAAGILFQRHLNELYTAYNSLHNLLSKKPEIHSILRIIADKHLDNYIFSYEELSNRYGFLYSGLLRQYQLRSNEYDPDKVPKFLERGKEIIFSKIENELSDRGYLNNTLTKWLNEEKKSLVLFHIYCQEKNLLKSQFKDGNDFLKELEKRYSFEVGDQVKPGLWKRQPGKYSPKVARAEYYFLDDLVR